MGPVCIFAKLFKKQIFFMLYMNSKLFSFCVMYSLVNINICAVSCIANMANYISIMCLLCNILQVICHVHYFLRHKFCIAGYQVILL